MRPSRARLAVTAVAFAAWVGWLGYLALTTTRPVVLSRPQFLAADAWVIAEVRAGPDGGPAATARLTRVLWSSGRPPADDITIANLEGQSPPQGWEGPGAYLLALSREPASKDNLYLVTPIPRSPTYHSGLPDPRTGLPTARIYPAGERVLREADSLRAEWKRN